MRVGVHTGKVICGLVGTRRFKFDVWSNDVTLANQMESSGQAGKVHISETTLEFVKDIYEVSEGEPVPGECVCSRLFIHPFYTFKQLFMWPFGFVDIRKVKVLVEYYNKEDQRYAIKHTQDQARKLSKSTKNSYPLFFKFSNGKIFCGSLYLVWFIGLR